MISLGRGFLKKKYCQPRSQSSSSISGVTSPVKLVGKIRYRARFQASSGHSDSANRPGYEAEILPDFRLCGSRGDNPLFTSFRYVPMAVPWFCK